MGGGWAQGGDFSDSGGEKQDIGAGDNQWGRTGREIGSGGETVTVGDLRW